jgi:hypothetical protein
MTKPLGRAIVVNMVKLTSDIYYQDKGSIGAVDQYYPETKHVFVSWIGGPKSGPVAEEDLEPLGELCISVPTEPDLMSW